MVLIFEDFCMKGLVILLELTGLLSRSSKNTGSKSTNFQADTDPLFRGKYLTCFSDFRRPEAEMHLNTCIVSHP